MRLVTTTAILSIALGACSQPASSGAPVSASQQPSTTSSYKATFKNNYFLNCSREMTSGADALPADLSLQVCSCAATAVVSQFSGQQLQEMDRDAAANYQRLIPFTESCVSSELPKYMAAHPDFLREYVKQHPEILE